MTAGPVARLTAETGNRRPLGVVPHRAYHRLMADRRKAMAGGYAVGAHYEDFIRRQVSSGRYSDAEAVVRDGLRLLEARDRVLTALDAAVAEGLADGDAGRVRDVDEVCDALLAELDGKGSPPTANLGRSA